MIEFEAPFSYRVDQLEDGRLRIDFPRSPLDGYIAQTKDEALSMVSAEADRMVKELLAQPDVQDRIAQLHHEAERCAPNLSLRVDVRDMIVFFPLDEMLGVDMTITMLRAYAGVHSRNELVELDDETYVPVLAHAQSMLREIAAERLD
jgi:hypothetical protein